METLAFRMQLRPGQDEEYRRRHDEIWPDVLQELKSAGISDFWFFFDGTSDAVFAVLKRIPGHDMDSLAGRAVMIRWWAHMADLMLTNADQSPVQFALTPIFHMA